jgi:hypothetical protein
LKIKDENDDDSTKSDERILAWAEKPGRKFISFQTFSATGQVIQSHDQVIDKHEKGDIITFEPKDMHVPLRLGLRINKVNSTMQPFFKFTTSGFDVKTVLWKLNFLSSLTNAMVLTVFIPEDNITSHIPLKIGHDPSLPIAVEFYRALSALEEETGTKFSIPKNTPISENLLLNAKILVSISGTKLIPSITNYNIKLATKLALAMLKDYADGVINNDLMHRTPYSQSILGNSITILNAQLNLSEFVPITQIDEIDNLTGIVEVILKPRTQNTTSQLNAINDSNDSNR